MNVRRHHGAGVEIDGVFRLVSQPVRPSFRRVMRASGSLGLVHSALPTFLAVRRRSNRLRSSSVGVATPLSAASLASISRQLSPVSRRVMPRIAAFASMVEASTPMRLPLTSPSAASRPTTQSNTRWCAANESRARVFASVEWSGAASVSPSSRKLLSDSESAQRQAIPRSESMPSK
jgi:hypothetical protein